MKKITLFLGIFLIAFSVKAQVTLSQSVDPVTIDTGGVACWASGTGEYRDNAFARTYDLASFGITGAWETSAVEFGQGSADDGKVVDVNIYTVDTEDLATALFVLVASVPVTLASADDLSLITVPIVASIPAGSIIAVEIFAPDEGTVTFQRFFPGFNLAGENSTPWLKSDGCTIPWSDANSVVADQNYVINVTGDTPSSGIADNVIEGFNMYPNPVVDVLNLKADQTIESVNIYNMLGQEVINTNKTAIDMSALPAGSYIVKVKAGQQFGSYNFVKQ